MDTLTNRAEEVLLQIRDWLKNGATIKATNPDVEVLKPLPDGTWYSGLTITFPSENSE